MAQKVINDYFNVINKATEERAEGKLKVIPLIQ